MMTDDQSSFMEELNSELLRLENADYYEILGVGHDAKEEEIRSRFRDLAKRYHVDRYAGQGLPKEIMAQMTQLLGTISRAHSVLTNPDKRRNYDATLDMRRAGLPTDLGTIVQSESIFRSGRTLLDQGKYSAALDKFEKACQLNPAEPEFSEYATYCRYWTLARGRDGQPLDRNAVKLIIDRLGEFQSENPNNDTVCVHLGMIAKVEDRPDRAQEYFKQAYRINPKNVVAARELRLQAMRAKNKPGGFFSRLFKKTSER